MAKLRTDDTALDFTLPATDGKTYNLHDAFKNARAVAVVFTCNHCPYAIAWEDRINSIARDYATQGVRLFAINANNASTHPADSFENMAKRASQKHFVFPYLHDESQSVARSYGPERTPEFFIFDAAQKKLLGLHIKGTLTGDEDQIVDDKARAVGGDCGIHAGNNFVFTSCV